MARNLAMTFKDLIKPKQSFGGFLSSNNSNNNSGNYAS